MDLSEKKRLLVAQTKSELRESNWLILHEVDTEVFPYQVDIMAYHDDWGLIAFVCHVKEDLDYCVREPQVQFCSRWKSPVFVRFSDDVVFPIRTFNKPFVLRLPGKTVNDLPYRRIGIEYCEDADRFKDMFLNVDLAAQRRARAEDDGVFYDES